MILGWWRGGGGGRWAVGSADNEIVGITRLDYCTVGYWTSSRPTSSHPTTFLNSPDRSPSPLGKVDAPLERGVSGCAGSPGSEGKGQRRALRCLFVPSCEGSRAADLLTDIVYNGRYPPRRSHCPAGNSHGLGGQSCSWPEILDRSQ
jgi:hypothetical protein